jgi:hypothetical protein
MVLMHFLENVNNHGPRDNVFWGSCPGLHGVNGNGQSTAALVQPQEQLYVSLDSLPRTHW